MMSVKYIISNIFVILVISLGMGGCEYYTENQPLDLVRGNVDLQAQYDKSQFMSPTNITGKVTNKTTKVPVQGVKITARLENSSTKYSTLSKEDGTFSFYVEGANTYIFYGEKDGFDKSYYFQQLSNGIDTTFLVNNYRSDVNISLAVHDPTPKFKVNLITTKSLSYSTSDFSFNGTYLTSMYTYSSTVNQFDSEGKYVKYTPFQSYLSFFACQTADVYWAGTYSGNTLYKIDAKTGSYLTTITCAISTTGFKDLEVYNGSIWLLNSTKIYKLSMTGDIQATLDLSKTIEDLNMFSITAKNNFLYILSGSSGIGYLLYKLDPETSKVVAKGYLPATMNTKSLQGLAFDKSNFWTFDNSGSSLMKFSITE